MAARPRSSRKQKGTLWRALSVLLRSFLIWFSLTSLFVILDNAKYGDSETPAWFAFLAVLVPIAAACVYLVRRALAPFRSGKKRERSAHLVSNLHVPPADVQPVCYEVPEVQPREVQEVPVFVPLEEHALPASLPAQSSRAPRTELSQRITVQDMLHFADSPYAFDQQLYTYVPETTHPDIFMDLSPHNIEIAKQHFSMLNSLIFEQFSNIPRLNPLFLVSPDSLAFYPYHDSYGYTRIVCTPYTPSGGISRSPFYLCYMTRLDNPGSSLNGMIFYGVDGRIRKATMNSWRRVSDDLPSDGWAFEFKDRGGQLALWEATTTLGAPNGYPMRSVYKHKDLLEEERVRDADRQSFLWLQRNLPGECPKTFPGFRRMKAANSKNYQVLQLKAEKLGRKI